SRASSTYGKLSGRRSLAPGASALTQPARTSVNCEKPSPIFETSACSTRPVVRETFSLIAYRAMKRLERDIRLRLREVSKREPLESAISLHQFFGIDIIPFAVELAKVTLMLAKELELIEAQKLAETDQLLIEEKPLPLDNLDKNIICADALFTEWPKADAIIGNPPYL